MCLKTEWFKDQAIFGVIALGNKCAFWRLEESTLVRMHHKEKLNIADVGDRTAITLILNAIRAESPAVTARFPHHRVSKL